MTKTSIDVFSIEENTAASKILNYTNKSHILPAGGWDPLPLSDSSLGDKGTEEAFPFVDDD